MASSRWKRFAFFERQTLTIPPDILEDLIPSSSSSSNNITTTKADGGGVTLGTHVEESTVQLTVSTAALPLDTQPAQIDRTRFQQLNNNNSNLALADCCSFLFFFLGTGRAAKLLMLSSLSTPPSFALTFLALLLKRPCGAGITLL